MDRAAGVGDVFVPDHSPGARAHMAPDPELLTISQTAARLPGARGARRVHPATVTRWILSGCPARDGRRVKLAATRAGGRWLVRPADLEAFFAALATEPSPQSPPLVPVVASDARRRAAQRAADVLKKMGA